MSYLKQHAYNLFLICFVNFEESVSKFYGSPKKTPSPSIQCWKPMLICSFHNIAWCKFANSFLKNGKRGKGEETINYTNSSFSLSFVNDCSYLVRANLYPPHRKVRSENVRFVIMWLTKTHVLVLWLEKTLKLTIKLTEMWAKS